MTVLPEAWPADLRELSAPDLQYALERLLVDYVHALDSDELERWPEFFVADATYKIVPRENFEKDLPMALMYCEGQGMMADRVTAIRETILFEPRILRHLTSSLRVDGFDADGSVRTTANYAVFESTSETANAVFNVGRYIDRVVVDDGRLKYAGKICVFDTSTVPTSLIYPI